MPSLRSEDQIPTGGPTAPAPQQNASSLRGGSMFPGLRAVSSGYVDDARRNLREGAYGSLAANTLRANLAAPVALADDIISPTLHALAPLGRGMVNVGRTTLTGDETPLLPDPGQPTLRTPAAPPAQPTAPNPTDLRLATGTQTAPVSQPPNPDLRNPLSNASLQRSNPAGQVTKTVGPDGRVSYSGADVKGDISLVDAGGTALPGSPGGGFVRGTGDGSFGLRGAPGANAADNAIMAANLRDGVDLRRGTSGSVPMAAQVIDAKPFGLRLADEEKPVVSINRQNADTSRMTSEANARNQAAQIEATLRGQTLTHDAAMRGQELNNSATLRGQDITREGHMVTAANNKARMAYDMNKDLRDFDYKKGQDAQTDRRQADKAWDDHAATIFQTVDSSTGKSVPDAGKIAAYTRAADETIGRMIPDLLQSGDPKKVAYGRELEQKGRSALDDQDRANFTKWFGVQQAHAGTYRRLDPFGSDGAVSSDLRTYANPRSDNGAMQPRTKFLRPDGKDTGISIPNVGLDYGPDANLWLPNWKPATSSLR